MHDALCAKNYRTLPKGAGNFAIHGVWVIFVWELESFVTSSWGWEGGISKVDRALYKYHLGI